MTSPPPIATAASMMERVPTIGLLDADNTELDEKDQLLNNKRPKLLRQLTMGENETKEDGSLELATKCPVEESPRQKEEDGEEGIYLDIPPLSVSDTFNVRSEQPFSSAMFAPTPRLPSAVATPAPPLMDEHATFPPPAPQLERVESWSEDVTDSSWRAW